MTITITLNTDNAAFAQFTGDDGTDEVVSILEEVIERISDHGPRRAAGPLRDSNGNTVGKIEVSR